VSVSQPSFLSTELLRCRRLILPDCAHHSVVPQYTPEKRNAAQANFTVNTDFAGEVQAQSYPLLHCRKQHWFADSSSKQIILL
jgi:hypothetical protein